MRLLPYSFRRRLTLLIALLLILGAAPVYWYLDYVHARQLVTDRMGALQDLANAVAAVVGENLRERQREIELLAQNELLRDAALDSPDVAAAIGRLQASYPHYSWIGLADTQGVVQAASGNLLKGASVAQRPWFIKGLQGPFIGDLHEAVLLAKLLPASTAGAGPIRFIDFTAPVRDAQGQVKGVLASHAHWRWAGEVVGAITPVYASQDGIEIFLVNRSGQVVYPEDEGTPAGIPATLSPVTTRRPRDAPPDFHRWEDGAYYLSAAATVREVIPTDPLAWRVVVRQPRTAALADVRTLQQVVLGATLASVLLFSVLAWLLARQVSRPLEQLATMARRVQYGEDVQDFTIPSRSREISQLVVAIRGMMATLLSRKRALETSNQQLESMVTERTSALAKANAELSFLARQDTLTGLPNRRAIDERLQADHARWRRHGDIYAVIVLDIDHFKRVNDTHGHAAGDDVLRALATCLRQQLRDTDLCGRQGGEEFLVIAAVANLAQAVAVAEKIRLAVAAYSFPVVGALTVSLGVAVAAPDDPHAEAIVQRADEQLYRAKQAGRNQVQPHQLDPDPAA